MQKFSPAAHWPRAIRGFSWLAAFWIALSLGHAAKAAPNEALQAPNESRGTRSLLPFRGDVHAVLTWEGDLGAGLRADVLVLDKTRLYNGRDELALSVGGDVSFVTFGGENRLAVWPTVTMQWSLSVSEHFVFYPELGIVAKVRPGDWDGLFPNVGFGARIMVYRSLAILARLGWPMAATVGLTF